MKKEYNKIIKDLKDLAEKLETVQDWRHSELDHMYERSGYLRGKVEAYERMLVKNKLIEPDKERINTSPIYYGKDK